MLADTVCVDCDRVSIASFSLFFSLSLLAIISPKGELFSEQSGQRERAAAKASPALPQPSYREGERPSHSTGDEIDIRLERYFKSIGAGPDRDLQRLKRHFPNRSHLAEENSYNFSNKKPNDKKSNNKKADLKRHRVAAGDTVWNISKRYGSSPAEIFRHNPAIRSRPIRIGEIILVRGNSASSAKLGKSQKPGKENGRPGRERVYYRVKRGDTLSAIGRRYGVSVAQIRQWNRLSTASIIQPRQKLIIFSAKRQGAVSSLRSGLFQWPLRGRVTSGFGRRRNPFVPWRTSYHNGIDIAAKMGTPFRSTGKGIVIAAGRMGSYGNCILVRHSNGFVSVYAHNMQNRVKKGDIVNRGEMIGRVGRTGSATGPHLHFEMRRGKKPINPLRALAMRELFIKDKSMEEISIEDKFMKDISVRDVSMRDVSVRDKSMKDKSIKDVLKKKEIANKPQ